MVPISLIVSSEIVKFAQSYFMQQDISMYYAAIDKPMKCNTSTIHEDLGCVDYIFSDKTGTLTQNKMVFRYASITADDAATDVVAAAAVDKAGSTTTTKTTTAAAAAAAAVPSFQTFGSQDTAIALMVNKRQQALADRDKTTAAKAAAVAGAAASAAAAGAAASKGVDVTDVAVAIDNNADEVDGRDGREKWTTLSAPLRSKPPPSNDGDDDSDSAHGCLYRTIFDVDDDGDVDDGAKFTPVEFTAQERATLMATLWGEENAARRQAHRYMRHLALSNTVEPSEEDGVLTFKSSTAEETVSLFSCALLELLLSFFSLCVIVSLSHILVFFHSRSFRRWSTLRRSAAL
jgi:magnesium-transporting ATPase (P-type)